MILQITADGLIVDESLVRKKVAEEDLKEYSDKLLAKAIVARSVEIEVDIVVEIHC